MVSHPSIALFGESQKGDFHTGYHCKTVLQLSECIGEPPSLDSKGVWYAVQSLLNHHTVIFFRVREEGFSTQDYLHGLKLLQNQNLQLAALCLPGVGDHEIIQATQSICSLHKSFLILTEQDLYDYLTCFPSNEK